MNRRAAAALLAFTALLLTGCGPSADEVAETARLEAENESACERAMAVFRETQDELDSISRVGFDANETFGLLAMRLKKTATDANGETKAVLTKASEAFSEWISLNAPLTPDGSIPLEVDHPMWMLEAECS